jgi:alpha/beta superfamily hydrolase
MKTPNTQHSTFNFPLSTFIFLLFTFNTYSQSIKGTWKGELNISGMSLPLVFHVDSTENGLISTMDSPSQGVKGIPTNTTVYSNNELLIQIDKIQFIYKGKLVSNDALNGEVTQFGKTFSMNMQRQLVQDTVKLKPQEPSQPYPYISEEVSFVNPIGGHSLAGTLTLPKADGRFPCAILISGSGPQNRDEELMGHKPFLVLADYLTRQGIAVLRFDDRGVGKSEGEFAGATTGDFATDVEAAIAYLKTRIDIISIGLIGHSEGGIIAPMVASRNKESVAFVVLLAGTGIRGKELLLLQSQLISKVNGVENAQIKKNTSLNEKLYNLVMTSNDNTHIKKEATKLMAEYSSTRVTDADVDGLLAQINSPWFRYFISLDPTVFLEKTTCHVLALNGTLDLQVPAKENLAAIEKSLKVAENKHYKIVSLKGLNHLFQKAKTGNPSEYATIEETFNPKALNEIGEWILEVYK